MTSSADARIRTAIVTGSSGLIGRAIAIRLRNDGWTVIGVDKDERSGPADRTIVADLATDDGLAAATEAIRTARGVRLLVNNAGVTGARQLPANVSVRDWDNAAAINVRPVIALSVTVAQQWIATNTPGSIVNLSSPGAIRAHLHRAVYDATKGAVDAFTRAFAVDVGEHGIRVNAVVPAQVTAAADVRADLPLRRGAAPENVADAVAFLASDAASATTGHSLAVDGGLLAQARSATVAVRADSGGVQ
jgi:3-oxoacyl-[acyl-carrier protein] reductase